MTRPDCASAEVNGYAIETAIRDTLTMVTMMESTTTIELAETSAPPQATSIDEIHIETTEERCIFRIFLEYKS